MKQSIRIIGGQFRGKKITFPEQADLRPTPDRVRETLFNWLMHDIRGSNCLDAFAGSGALGIEAFSRGAGRVTFIESASNVFSHLKQTCQSFKSSQLIVIQDDCSRYLEKASQDPLHPFDIVFFDPPFSKPNLLNNIDYLKSPHLLKPQGLLYLETPQEFLMDPCVWRPLKSKRAGQIVYALYQKVP